MLKIRTMKKIKTTIITAALILPTLAFSAWDACRPPMEPCGPQLIGDTRAEISDDKIVDVDYILDTDGIPYIVSVHSEDPQATRLIRSMMKDLGLYPFTGNDDPSLNISFYYDHIR